jgi:hypothetical protein
MTSNVAMCSIILLYFSPEFYLLYSKKSDGKKEREKLSILV